MGREPIHKKINMLKRNAKDLEDAFKNTVQKEFNNAELSIDEWGIDLDKGVFVRKPTD